MVFGNVYVSLGRTADQDFEPGGTGHGMGIRGSMSTVLVWSIAAAAIAGVLFRPKDWPEAVWACLGAALLVICGLIPIGRAGAAVAKGTDVYLFLAGMMMLAELARQKGVFDWLAGLAVAAAKNSQARLFTLVYGVGILVTVFLSNDATAVVLTPAVYAAVQRARSKPLPYLLICAFIANAASFVLPISNPANLVVYGKRLPPLAPWLGTFLLPSVLSIGATYLMLRWLVRNDIQGRVEDGREREQLTEEGRHAAWGILGAAAVLICASGFGLSLGLPACISALIAVLIATRASIDEITGVLKHIPWSVLPLVAGLFVLVEALSGAGALRDMGMLFTRCATLPPFAGALAASFGIAALSNLMNNLPSGLLAGGALQSFHAPSHIRDAVLIGVDLGPNLSVTGSLATILWLIALRREGERISGWRFLKVGLLVMPPALLLAAAAAALLSR
jgi:arsenical pump membrane protein